MWKRSLSLVLVGGLVIGWIQFHIPQKHLKDEIVFGFNDDTVSYSPDFLRITSFGYAHSISALLWLRFLQQTPPKKVGANQLSWIYYDLDAVTELDPDFYPAYGQGGIFLSVITEDKRGAEKIFLKGIKQYPDRWRLRGYLAYHYQFELDEPSKAGEQYLAGAKLPGAPDILKVLAGSFMMKDKGKGAAIELLKSFLATTKDEGARERILIKIKKIEASSP